MIFTKPDFTDPASVVRAFIHQMYCWEALAGSLYVSAEARFRDPADPSTMHPKEMEVLGLTREIPKRIVDIFLTQRVRAYVPSGSYSIPPQHDPSTESVTRVAFKTNSQVVVETNRKAMYFGGVREYVVKKRRGVWLIDSVSVSIGPKKQKLPLV